MISNTLTLLCNHYPQQHRTFLSYPIETLCPLNTHCIPPTSQSLATSIPLPSVWLCWLWIIHICGTMCIACHDWLILLSLISVSFTLLWHIAEFPLLKTIYIYIYVCIYIHICIYVYVQYIQNDIYIYNPYSVYSLNVSLDIWVASTC